VANSPTEPTSTNRSGNNQILQPIPASANCSAIFRQNPSAGENRLFSLSVPYISGSSRGFNVPGPQFGNDDKKMDAWPPQPPCERNSTISAAKQQQRSWTEPTHQTGQETLERGTESYLATRRLGIHSRNEIEQALDLFPTSEMGRSDSHAHIDSPGSRD
jgi:hypothetical protein